MVAIWYCERNAGWLVLACKHLDRHLETDLVQTPRVPVEQHLHTVIQHGLGFFAGQQQPFLFPPFPGGFSVFVCFPEERLGEMGGEPGSQGRGLVSRPQEINVSEETGERAFTTFRTSAT
jgi:hypothetical protein